MGYGSWKTLGAVANVIMVVTLLISIAERAAYAAFAVVPLIVIAAYAEYRADKLRRKEEETRV
jgi:hypothetical protein